MSIVDDVVASPWGWTAEQVVDLVALHQYDEGDRRRDPDLPRWLREVLVVCDLDTQLQMDGLLGWLENRAAQDLDLVVEALVAIGMPADAGLLRDAAGLLDPGQLAEQNERLPVHTVSTFAERHGPVSPQDQDAIAGIQNGLFVHAPDGPDVYALLVAHADTGLHAERHSRTPKGPNDISAPGQP